MKKLLRTNWALVLYSWKDFVEYRGYMVFWIILESLGFFVMYFLWMFIYKKNDMVAGFSLSSMITYYFVVYIIKEFTVSYYDWNVIKKIRTGDFAHFLYRPLGSFRYYFFKNVGEKAIRIVLSVPILGGMIWLLRDYFLWPQNTWMFLLSLLISFLLICWFTMTLAYVSFWTENGEMFIYFKDSLVYYLSGAMIPLVLFGNKIAAILSLLPFRYFVSFPVEIYLGKLSNVQMYQGFGISLAWLTVFVVLEKYVYRVGVRKFTAVGN